ncbi:MAG TPA: phosphoglycerate dehydrogenase [Gemmataceae bacterium]|nr:phosphoglycerate dehydrogenase [Gemmataceae bacterium]
MPKVLIAPMTLAGIGGPYLDLLRQAGFEPIYPPRAGQLTEAELLQLLPGVSATIAGSEPYTRRVIESNPALRVIARAGVGFDAVDLKAATDHGIAVTTTPGTNHGSVAEHTFGLMLALARRIASDHCAVKAGGWPRQPTLPLRGRTLGIAGLGRIGKAVATRALAFEMRVLAYEPFPDRDFVRQHGIELVPLDRLLAESDYVSLHVPLTPESRHLINKRTLALMRPTAFLINTARGGLVCEADLLEALRAGRLAGAGLDVLEKEPPEGVNPLTQLDNVVVTPHSAGVDLQSRDDMALSSARSIVRLSRGEWPEAEVVKEVRAKFRW